MKSMSAHHPRRYTFRTIVSLLFMTAFLATTVYVATDGGTRRHIHHQLHYHRHNHSSDGSSSQAPEPESTMTAHFKIDGAWKSFRAAKGLSELPEVMGGGAQRGMDNRYHRLGHDSWSSGHDCADWRQRPINRFDVEARRRFWDCQARATSTSAEFVSRTKQSQSQAHDRVPDNSDEIDAAELSLQLPQLYLAEDARRIKSGTIDQIVETFREAAQREERKATTTAADTQAMAVEHDQSAGIIIARADQIY